MFHPSLTPFEWSIIHSFLGVNETGGGSREARDAGRGLWNADALPTLTAAEATDHIGSTATVCGTVASTKFAQRSNAQPTYLNLDRPYPDQLLTVVIWGTDRASFGEPEKLYSGKRICVTGKVELFKGRPQIIARERRRQFPTFSSIAV